MYRYDTVDKVADIAIDEVTKELVSRGELTDQPWQFYVLKSMLNSYRNNLKKCEFDVREYGINIEQYFHGAQYTESVLSVMETELNIVMTGVRKRVGNKFVFGKGDDLLRQVMYYVYTSNHPDTVLDMDVEFKKAEKKPSEVIKSELSRFCANLSEKMCRLSRTGALVWYVYQKWAESKGIVDETFRKYRFNQSSFLVTLDQRLLREQVSGRELDDCVKSELYAFLITRLSLQTINMTPIPCLLCYYMYHQVIETDVFDYTQTVTAYDRVTKSVFGDILYDPEERDRIRGLVNQIVLRCIDTKPDTASDSEREKYANIIESLQGNESAINIVIGELKQYTNSGVNYMSEEYNATQLLQAYYYDRVVERRAVSDITDEVAIRAISEIRKSLPVTLNELSDYGVLLVGVRNLSLEPSDSGHYKYINVTEYLTEEDAKLLSDMYGEVDVVSRMVKGILDRYVDSYWVKPDTCEDIIHILGRCYCDVTAYTRMNKVPILDVVAQKAELKYVVDYAIGVVAADAGEKNSLSTAGVWVRLLRQAHELFGNEYVKPEYHFTEGDLKFLSKGSENQLTEEELQKDLGRAVSLQLHMIGCPLKTSVLTLEDLIKLGIYCGVLISTRRSGKNAQDSCGKMLAAIQPISDEYKTNGEKLVDCVSIYEGNVARLQINKFV